MFSNWPRELASLICFRIGSRSDLRLSRIGFVFELALRIVLADLFSNWRPIRFEAVEDWICFRIGHENWPSRNADLFSIGSLFMFLGERYWETRQDNSLVFHVKKLGYFQTLAQNNLQHLTETKANVRQEALQTKR